MREGKFVDYRDTGVISGGSLALLPLLTNLRNRAIKRAMKTVVCIICRKIIR